MALSVLHPEDTHPVRGLGMKGQLPLFDLGVYDEPDTLTKAEYYQERTAALRTTWRRRREVEVRLSDPPVSWGGRPYTDVPVVGDVL